MVQVKAHISKGEKPKAMVALKRKKMLEKQAKAVQNVRPTALRPLRSY